MPQNNIHLNDLYNEFLPELKRSAPEATYQTHHCLVESLTQFFAGSEYDDGSISADDVAAFLRIEAADLQQATIQGYLSTLSNVLGYLWQDDPAVCKRKVAVALDNTMNEKSGWSIPTQKLTEAERISVEVMRDWLRRHQYGSRLHTVVEVIIDVCGRPSVARGIDRGDLDVQNQAVTVALPEAYALKQYEITETRTVELSPIACDVLKQYCQYDRRTPAAGDQGALFTTSLGRVSRSTLSRDCRKANQKIDKMLSQGQLVEQPCSLGSGTMYQSVSLEQIWLYSLDRIAYNDG